MTNIVHTLASQRTDLAIAGLEARGALSLIDYDAGNLEILKVGSGYTLEETDVVDFSLVRRQQHRTLDQVREEVLRYFTTLVKFEML